MGADVRADDLGSKAMRRLGARLSDKRGSAGRSTGPIRT